MKTKGRCWKRTFFMLRASGECRDTAEDSAGRLFGTPICHFTDESASAAKIRITERSGNVYENKGSVLEEMRLNRECI